MQVKEQAAGPVRKWATVQLELGASLAVPANEHAVIVQSGRVLGGLGPGAHVLQPPGVAFVLDLIPGADCDIFLVNTQPSGEIPLMEVASYRDPETRLAVKLTCAASCVLRVSDPVEVVSKGKGDATGATAVAYAVSRAAEALQLAVYRCIREEIGVRELLAGRHDARIQRDALAIANERVPDFGMVLQHLSRVALSIDPEDAERMHQTALEQARGAAEAAPEVRPRLAPGQAVQVTDGDGGAVNAVVTEARASEYLVRFEDRRRRWVGAERLSPALELPANPSKGIFKALLDTVTPLSTPVVDPTRPPNEEVGPAGAGDLVWAQANDQWWYPAVVVRKLGFSEYEVEWEDEGVGLAVVPEQRIRKR